MRQSAIDFNHVLIYVSDVKRAVRFYRDRLGFQIIEEEKGYARLRSPRSNSTIGLHHLRGRKRPSQRQGGITLYFEVKNLDQLCRKLASEGVKIGQMPEDMPWGWRHAYLRDPDGHELSLYWAGKKRFQKS
jgi:catechol 2,3-dioxygenase-like lactoylglutathione lyase family enzyme